eukprot:gene36538-45058_t
MMIPLQGIHEQGHQRGASADAAQQGYHHCQQGQRRDGLLPIVRNTCTGIGQVQPGLKLAAQALGLRGWHKLVHVELPLAMPVILAGVKTAAVMSVGTATIAAFIGAGGYGERITIGLALNDNDMLLAGALPV